MSWSHSAFSALRVPTFRNLIICQFFNVVAIIAQEVLLAIHLFQVTGDPLVLGLVGIAEAIPYIALSTLGGYTSDRFHPKKVLVFAFGGYIFSTLFLISLCSNSIVKDPWNFQWVAYAGIFFVGMSRAFFTPAASSLRTSLISESQYANGSTWYTAAWQSGAILGPLLAGLLAAKLDVQTGLMCILGIYLFSFYFMTRIKVPQENVKRRSEPVQWAHIKEGFKYVLNEKVILFAITLDLISVLFAGMVAIIPAFGEKVLGVGPEGIGILRAASSFGALCMIPVLAMRSPMAHAWRNLMIAVAGFTLCILCFGITRSLWLCAFFLAASGAFDCISVVIRHTLIQLRTPPHMRGRVFAVNGIFVSSSNEIGAFESGLAARMVGIVPSILLGAGISGLCLGWIYYKTRSFLKIPLDTSDLGSTSELDDTGKSI